MSPRDAAFELRPRLLKEWELILRSKPWARQGRTVRDAQGQKYSISGVAQSATVLRADHKDSASCNAPLCQEFLKSHRTTLPCRTTSIDTVPPHPQHVFPSSGEKLPLGSGIPPRIFVPQLLSESRPSTSNHNEQLIGVPRWTNHPVFTRHKRCSAPSSSRRYQLRRIGEREHLIWPPGMQERKDPATSTMGWCLFTLEMP